MSSARYTHTSAVAHSNTETVPKLLAVDVPFATPVFAPITTVVLYTAMLCPKCSSAMPLGFTIFDCRYQLDAVGEQADQTTTTTSAAHSRAICPIFFGKS